MRKLFYFYLKFEVMRHVCIGGMFHACDMRKRARKMADTWRLDVLPSEVLLIIFDYCDELDLLRLSEVCKRFNEIMHADMAWAERSKKFLATNQMSERFRNRCHLILRPRTTWLVSYNWHYGIYRKYTILSRKERMMPWMRLTSDTLWWCGGKQLLGFPRKGLMIDTKHDYYYIPFVGGGDICRFVFWRNFIICGYTNGTINYFLKNERIPLFGDSRCQFVKILLNNHSCDINAIDATSEYVISGLECGAIKMHRHPMMDTSDKYIYDQNDICVRVADKVRSLSVDPTGTRFAVGSAGTTAIPPLHIIDIERYTEVNTMRHVWKKRGAGVLDMVWDDPHTLLTCGYDTYIRKWDLRTRKCVCSWPDPTDATLYCIASDHQYTMVTGTQYNCLAVLWDQRKSDFVQLYYMNSGSSSESSPIYSLQFDNAHLYCATDKYLNVLDFSARLYQKVDYKSMYVPTSRSCR